MIRDIAFFVLAAVGALIVLTAFGVFFTAWLRFVMFPIFGLIMP